MQMNEQNPLHNYKIVNDIWHLCKLLACHWHSTTKNIQTTHVRLLTTTKSRLQYLPTVRLHGWQTLKAPNVRYEWHPILQALPRIPPRRQRDEWLRNLRKNWVGWNSWRQESKCGCSCFSWRLVVYMWCDLQHGVVRVDKVVENPNVLMTVFLQLL